MGKKRDGREPSASRVLRESDEGVPQLDSLPGREERRSFLVDAAAEVKRIVQENRSELTDVERSVIERRFGIEKDGTDSGQTMTLEQVGQIIGATKDRVRQMNSRMTDFVQQALDGGTPEQVREALLGFPPPFTAATVTHDEKPKLKPVILRWDVVQHSFIRER